jgi:hypothetical protein
MNEPTIKQIEAIGASETRDQLAAALKEIDPIVLAQAGIV